MALNIDLAPTILDLAGVAIPESMQGKSMAPLLRGERPADGVVAMRLEPPSATRRHGRGS